MTNPSLAPPTLADKAIAPNQTLYAEAKTLACVEGPGVHCAAEDGASRGYVLGEFKMTHPDFQTEYAMKVCAAHTLYHRN